MGDRYLIGARKDPAEIPVTIQDCGTRSQLLAVETLVHIGVEVELVEPGQGIIRPLKILANGKPVDILPYGRPEHRPENVA